MSKSKKQYKTFTAYTTSNNSSTADTINPPFSSTAGNNSFWEYQPIYREPEPDWNLSWNKEDVVVLDDKTLVKIGDKVMRWGDVAKKLEIILEILKEEIEIYEIADALTDGREEDIELP